MTEYFYARFYFDTITDRRFYRLSDGAVRTYFELMALWGQGRLSAATSNRDIADDLHRSERNVARGIAELEGADLVVHPPRGEWRVLHPQGRRLIGRGTDASYQAAHRAKARTAAEAFRDRLPEIAEDGAALVAALEGIPARTRPSCISALRRKWISRYGDAALHAAMMEVNRAAEVLVPTIPVVLEKLQAAETAATGAAKEGK
jgi:hypothetical protein